MPLLCRLRRFLVLLLLAWLGLALGPARAGTLLQLQDRQGEVPAWPAVRMLVDADGSLTVDAVQRRLAEFRTPDSPTANLPPPREAVLLSPPPPRTRGRAGGGGGPAGRLRAPAGDGLWVFSIDSPPLNHADLYVLRAG